MGATNILIQPTNLALRKKVGISNKLSFSMSS